jgi:spore coat polysaccharide biosynthesis protein SpsF
MKVVAIIQARMNSSRLPGKVLAPMAGEPMLTRVMNRVRRASSIDEVVVATTTRAEDQQIVDLCVQQRTACFRGSEADVLDRYYQAALHYESDIVVRITSDCPLIDPETIHWLVLEFIEKGDCDYLTNALPPRTFPRGLDVEVLSFFALARAWREDDNPDWREHVTAYIYRHPELFRLHILTHPADYSYVRWTVDETADLDFIQRIYQHFGHDAFSWKEALAVVEQNPEWLIINSRIQQKTSPEEGFKAWK